MKDITEEIKDHMARKYNARQLRELQEAQERQREIARQNRGTRKSMDGVGAPVMEVDSKVYHEWCRKEGKEIWKDPAFRRRMAREHPELVVKARGTGRTQVGYGS